ncbi:alanine racemase [Microbacterium sp. Marseille-Q6965]|uniref:alanine racemase n=1 Tax=Microbacterium sp. Marseille-Q6965 TaxID=2965072 RepID=UPI0021B70C00|nr:alanine racemase C-terminal domain-containing protein [Microbacterium sp. Marseille-Q6965]
MKRQPEMTAPAFREIEIDLAQLAANVDGLRRAQARDLVVDVGADAWGHGLAVVVPALVALGVDRLAVPRLDEAARVRALSASAQIITTQHAADESFRAAAELGVTPLVRRPDEVERALAAGVGGVFLAEETGGGLPGLTSSQIDEAIAAAARQGAAAHLASTLSVVGAEVFGVSERETDEIGEQRPVLRLWAPIAATKRVRADEGVSYGYTYRTRADTVLALVTLGYADGLDRAAGNRVAAAVAPTPGGRPRTIAGRVAMDAFMLDLGDAPAPPLGTPVTVLGDPRRGEPDAFAHARALGTHSAEVVTRLSARPRRRATGSDR